MNVKELKKKLDKLGVSYGRLARKKKLESLLDKVSEANADSEKVDVKVEKGKKKAPKKPFQRFERRKILVNGIEHIEIVDHVLGVTTIEEPEEE